MNRIFFILCFCVNFLLAQQTDYVDFKEVKSVLFFNQMKVDSTVFNSYEIKFDILKETDSVYLDAVDMKFMNVALNEASISYKNDGKKLIIYNEFEASRSYKLNFLFFAAPKKAMYFVGWEDSSTSSGQVWTQGQGKYTSHWMPSIDDMNDKIEFDLSFAAPKGYQVISNGKMVSKRETPLYNLWEYDMQKPMSSYLVALAIGKFDKKVEYSKSGIPLEMYYYPEDSMKFEPTYRHTKQMFDFLEDEIGVPFPWQNYKQVPVKDFLYAGMENTSATIFADSFVIDSIAFVDKNYVNVNAHELAHQWFGDLVTETSGTHHWLQEGFATYYALLAERNIFGDAYYYWRLYEYAQELLEQEKAGGNTSLLDPKSSSITFYKKGAWVLYMLRERVGNNAFKKAVKNYLEKYQYKNVETDNFISEVEKASGLDLSEFVEVWLEDEKYLYEDCINTLKKNSKDISELLELDQEFMLSSHSLDYSFNRYWEQATSYEIKSHLFSKDAISLVHDSIIRKALNSKDIKIRQAVAQNLYKIPLELKIEYESLLDDKSYITIEVALFNLWKNFPQERQKYFDKTKNIQGFSNKNIRMLWLALNIISPDFEDKKIREYYQELTNYTSPEYGFEVRQNAFQYLNQIQACGEVCKGNLEQATKHHNWRFSKFAKELLKSKQ
ncbi:MAG: M1 family metallopeptidase [Algibacter sp.]|uniref:M1 family metallopeptidase n=1 Tax=Algibacter sp. TaxID=1872428 RepID=UPI0026095BC0|nr:M1 family metallopeptidase [Algibacter sp.]MDG1730426.1 M1 family metallopeptidase [Algibacter sp.]MDG2179543.1 M1 family metallopeptidase [Algibacter sp.]